MKDLIHFALQIAVILFGLLVFAFLLYEPQLEGRNIDATQFEIYFNDPFLACVYAASVLFFVTLYQVYVLLGYARLNVLASLPARRALRVIRYCTRTLIALVVVAEVCLVVLQPSGEDIAGGVAIGMLTIFLLMLIAMPTTMLERNLQR